MHSEDTFYELIPVEGGPERWTAVCFIKAEGVEVLQDVQVVGHVPVDDQGTLVWSGFLLFAPFEEFLGTFYRAELDIVPKAFEYSMADPGEAIIVIDEWVEDVYGDVAPCDIVGAYNTDSEGVPVGVTFTRNPNHQLVTSDGTFSALLSDERLYEANLAVADVAARSFVADAPAIRTALGLGRVATTIADIPPDFGVASGGSNDK